jgi:hypothetical protein
VAGVAAAAVLAAGLALAPHDVGRAPATSATPSAAVPREAPDPAAQAALLRAQAADGRWTSATRHDDEAATGLALVALLEDRRDALHAAPVARAVADATRWLRSRQSDDGGFGARDAEGMRGHALATQGLLEVWAASRDASLQAALAPAVRRLEDDVRHDATNVWPRRALARARALGWRTSVEATPAPWALPGAPDASLCARVLAVLAR